MRPPPASLFLQCLHKLEATQRFLLPFHLLHLLRERYNKYSIPFHTDLVLTPIQQLTTGDSRRSICHYQEPGPTTTQSQTLPPFPRTPKKMSIYLCHQTYRPRSDQLSRPGHLQSKRRQRAKTKSTPTPNGFSFLHVIQYTRHISYTVRYATFSFFCD